MRAEIEDGDAIGDPRHDGQIVRDEEVGQPGALAQVEQQVHDLRARSRRRAPRPARRRRPGAAASRARARSRRAGAARPRAPTGNRDAIVGAEARPPRAAARTRSRSSRPARESLDAQRLGDLVARPASAGSARSADPGRRSAARAAAAAAPRPRAPASPSPSKSMRARVRLDAGARRCARRSSCRCPTRRRARASRPGAIAKSTPRSAGRTSPRRRRRPRADRESLLEALGAREAARRRPGGVTAAPAAGSDRKQRATPVGRGVELRARRPSQGSNRSGQRGANAQRRRRARARVRERPGMAS